MENKNKPIKRNKEETIYDSSSYWNKILTKEFSKESDRASIILTAAMFDNALENLLKNYLLPVSGNNDELFDGANAPLSNFSSHCLKDQALVRYKKVYKLKFCHDNIQKHRHCNNR